MALALETQYPTIAERPQETADKRREKALAASHRLLGATFFLEVLDGETISKGTQSQLIEKCWDPLHEFPSSGYQNATANMLD